MWNALAYFTISIGCTILGLGIGFMIGIIHGMHAERNRKDR